MNSEYIHSYEESEQDRLVSQAEFLEPFIHPFLNFEPTDSVLEIGCGVGAQMKIVLRRHEIKKLTGIDFEPKQIEKAKLILSEEIATGKVELAIGSGENLPYASQSFDAIYIFFVLEHFKNPFSIIREVKRVLKPGGKFYCTEVFNSGIYIYPENKFLMSYWNKFNNLQRKIGGNPDIGIQLPNLCISAGLTVEKFISTSPMLDKRMIESEKRRAFLNPWESLFLSGYPLLRAKQAITKGMDKKISLEFEKILQDLESIFLYSLKQILVINKEVEPDNEWPSDEWKDWNTM